MKHQFYAHENCDTPGSCQFCDGGLAYCTVCKFGEGSLPTDCPGGPVSNELEAEIYNGARDFINGKWVCKK